MKNDIAIATAAGSIVTGATVAASPTFLHAIGFGTNGIVAGSALLTGSFPPEFRVPVQGLADLVMTASGAAAGLASGLVVTWAGFSSLSHWSGVLGLAPTIAVLVGRTPLVLGMCSFL